eukprot:m.91677 g.91677  ORF g.91677 m.91677 type:complete len:108 (+) comp36704_c0_seq5:47-370(+)
MATVVPQSLSSDEESSGSANLLPDNQECEKTGLESFERALDAAGQGSFQKLVLFACVCANAANAVVVTCISLVVPSLSRPGGFGLTTTEKGVLTAIVFPGLLIGDIF